MLTKLWWCADDIFLSFATPKYLQAFQNYVNGGNANISFKIENENQNRMSFLDVQSIREGKKFSVSVYQELTFSGVNTNLESF